MDENPGPVETANIAAQAENMLLDGHNLGSICEMIRSRVPAKNDPDKIEGQVCHVLRVMYSNLSRKMARAAEEYGVYDVLRPGE